MKTLQVIFHILSRKKQAQIQTIPRPLVHPGVSYPFSLLYRVYRALLFEYRYNGGLKRLPYKHSTPRGHKAPYRYHKPTKEGYTTLANTYATKRVRPTGLRSDQHFTSNGFKTTRACISRWPNYCWNYPMASSYFNQCPTYKGAKLRTRPIIGQHQRL